MMNRELLPYPDLQDGIGRYRQFVLYIKDYTNYAGMLSEPVPTDKEMKEAPTLENELRALETLPLDQLSNTINRHLDYFQKKLTTVKAELNGVAAESDPELKAAYKEKEKTFGEIVESAIQLQELVTNAILDAKYKASLEFNQSVKAALENDDILSDMEVSSLKDYRIKGQKVPEHIGKIYDAKEKKPEVLYAQLKELAQEGLTGKKSKTGKRLLDMPVEDLAKEKIQWAMYKAIIEAKNAEQFNGYVATIKNFTSKAIEGKAAAQAEEKNKEEKETSLKEQQALTELYQTTVALLAKHREIEKGFATWTDVGVLLSKIEKIQDADDKRVTNPEKIKKNLEKQVRALEDLSAIAAKILHLAGLKKLCEQAIDSANNTIKHYELYLAQQPKTGLQKLKAAFWGKSASQASSVAPTEKKERSGPKHH